MLKFRKQSAKEVWAVWSAHEDDDWQVELKSSASKPKPLTFTEVGGGAIERPWGSRNWAEQQHAPLLLDQMEITVRSTPWLITGDLSNVRFSAVKKASVPRVKPSRCDSACVRWRRGSIARLSGAREKVRT